jgi:hypothetical protein
MFPCHLVTTSDLTVRRRRRRKAPTNGNKTVTTKRPGNQRTRMEQPLEQTAGLKILTHLYDKLSITDTIYQPEPVQLPVDTFFQGDGSRRQPPRQQQQSLQQRQELTLLEKTELLLKLRPVPENIPQITKSFLRRWGLTMRTLCELGVALTDLYKAGIVQCYQDLLDLDFRLRDLTIDSACLSPNHMYTLFQMTGRDLNITVVDLLECRFTAAELTNMDFSLPHMIEANGIKAQHLRLLGYTPQDLRLLGVDGQHLKQLGITDRTAYQLMGWAPTQVNVFK